MTRKKFMKQLMAMGYQRNAAEVLAMFARMEGLTYDQYLQKEKQDLAFHAAIEKLKTAVNDIAAAVAKVLTDAAEQMRKVWETHPLYGIDWAKGPDQTAYTPMVLPLCTSNTDELCARFGMVDEVSQWPKENPHLGGGGA